MGLIGNKRSLVIVCFMTFTISSFSSSSSSPDHDHKGRLLGPLLKSLVREAYLAPHNKARAEVGVPPLKWNDTLAAYAESYAKARSADCQMVHSQGPYGENLAEGSAITFTGAEAVKLWVDEKQFYDYDTNSCASGQQCGHYTQVVWSKTTDVGCAKVRCDSGWWFVICSYDPPGNYVGDWPYEVL